MKSKMNVIFPIPPIIGMYLFKRKRAVFVKYTNFKKLEQGSKIIFYLSGRKKLIGEGTIEQFMKLNPALVWSIYGQQMLISKTEYEEYVARSPIDGQNRKTSKITVFVLKNLKKYQPPISWLSGSTATGKYLPREEYQKIRKLQRTK